MNFIMILQLLFREKNKKDYGNCFNVYKRQYLYRKNNDGINKKEYDISFFLTCGCFAS